MVLSRVRRGFALEQGCGSEVGQVHACLVYPNLEKGLEGPYTWRQPQPKPKARVHQVAYAHDTLKPSPLHMPETVTSPIRNNIHLIINLLI